jgi:protease I
MTLDLEGIRIAILATDGFEQSELTEPHRELIRRGATVHVVAPKAGEIRGWNHADWGDSFQVDTTLDQANAAEYDALVLPGGVINPDHLRLENKAIAFVKAFASAGKPIAAICHGPWTLINAGAVKGRTVTSWPSLRVDLENAGARWVDQPCVVDGMLVTSRKPDDLPVFVDKAAELFAKARGTARHAAE